MAQQIKLALYILSSLLYLYLFASSKQNIGKWATYVTLAGVVIHALAIVFRTIEAQRAPLSNQYEFASVFAWGIALCYIYLEWKYKFKYQVFGTFVMPFAVIIIVYAATLPKEDGGGAKRLPGSPS